MTITLDTKQLRAAAAQADAVALGGKEGAAPIFANVLIAEGEGGRVRFSATDLDTAIARTVPMVQGTLARDPLRVTVSAKYLKAIAEKLPADAQVALEKDDVAGLKLTCGRSKFKLGTLPPEDFPEFPREDWDAQFEVSAIVLGELIDRIGFAAGREATRYYLSGIYLHAVQDGDWYLRAAATDGSRLARTQIALPEGADQFPKAGVIVPNGALKVIRDLLKHVPVAEEGEHDTIVSVAVSGRRIEVDAGDGTNDATRFASKLIDGTFPAYDRVIPTGNDRVLKIDREALDDAVERVTTIATEKVRIVKMSLAPDLVTLSVTSPESGTATEEVPADYVGPAMEVGFNAVFLREVLGRIRGDLSIALGDPAAPCLLTGSDDPDSLFVLMPMRV